MSKQGIKLKNRFEHTHILGGTGHGKTQLLQYMIYRDLKEDCCVIVIDNQRQMIPKLAQLGVDMAYINPEYPLALNMFDQPRSHTTVPLLKFVLAGLMEAELTPKQTLIFEFASQLMLEIPGATIRTFRDLLDVTSKDEYPPFFAEHISNLDAITKEFFYKEYLDRQFDMTKKEISWRVWSLLKNPLLANMFAAEENRFNILDEMDRKLILIDTDTELLQEYSGFFGRFFLAQILQAAQSRFKGKHRPVYVYIDEAYYYFDSSIVSMLETARKASIGLIMAHQYLGQIRTPQVLQAIMSLTSTKFAGGLSANDVRMMASAMRCDPDYIDAQRKLKFALSIKGTGLHSIDVPTGVIEKIKKKPIPKDEMIKRYGRRPAKKPVPVAMEQNEEHDEETGNKLK